MPWVSLKTLHEQTSFAVRSLQYIRTQEPGVLVTRERGGRTEYKQPDCAANLIRREARLAKPAAHGGDHAAAKDRALLAEAQLKELELRTKLGQVLSNDVFDATVREIGDRLRAVLVNIPATYALRLEECGLAADRADAVLKAITADLTLALRASADELDAAAVAATVDGDDDPVGSEPPLPRGRAARAKGARGATRRTRAA
jgi:phage terminase Nu1 subunit (DNA packaging protein)